MLQRGVSDELPAELAPAVVFEAAVEEALVEQAAQPALGDDLAGDTPTSAVGAELTTKASSDDVGVDDLTCAICLEQTPMEDTAIVKGCEHAYCVHCILRWATQKEACTCPKCKAPFSYLFTYRQLDGTLHDFPLEESVCLLKRATWFEAHLKELEKGKAPADAPPLTSQASFGDDYSRFYDEYDEDDEVEAYYFSSAAGRARICLGNRRFGENGYISAGRMQARPVPQQTGKAGKDKGKAAAAPPAARSSPPGNTTPASKGKAKASTAPVTPNSSSSSRSGKGPRASSVGSDDMDTPGSAGSKQGRRARRKAQRAAMDMRDAGYF